MWTISILTSFEFIRNLIDQGVLEADEDPVDTFMYSNVISNVIRITNRNSSVEQSLCICILQVIDVAERPLN